MSKSRDPNNLQLASSATDEDVKDLFDHEAENFIPNLKKLHIYQHKVTDKGIKYIGSAISKEGSTLENFGLSNQKITIEGLIKNTSLVYLNLSYSNIGDEGAIYLANALENNKNIKGLELVKCSIGKRGGKALTTVCASKLNLNKIFLNFNEIETKDIINLFEKNWCLDEIKFTHKDHISIDIIISQFQADRCIKIKEIVKKINEDNIISIYSENIYKMSSLLKLPFSKLKEVYSLSDKDLFTLESFFNSKSFFLPKAFICKGTPDSDLGFFNQIPNELFENIFQYVSFFDLKLNLYTTEYRDNDHEINPIGEININENIQ